MLAKYYDDCWHLFVGAAKCYVEIDRELSIGKGGWERKIIIQFWIIVWKVELTNINDTSKGDIHVPLQHQPVHRVGLHDVQQVGIEVIQVHLVKNCEKLLQMIFNLFVFKEFNWRNLF